MKYKDAEGFINRVSLEEIIAALKRMELDPRYQTERFYRGTSHRWTDNYLSFVEYHINYLKAYPSLDPDKYISNLRLKLRK